jgi:tetratricopeptide (TPR) repeat protein
MIARHASCIAALAVALVAGARAEDASPIDVAHAAQAAYDHGVATLRTDPQASAAAFRESIEAWERLLATGIRNGELEFNLGNARLQSGDVGRAIAAYLRAERLMPGDPDLQANLAHARSMVSTSFGRSGGTVLVDSVTRVWHLVPHDLRMHAGIAAWVALGVLGALRLAVRPAPTGGLRTAWTATLWALGAIAALSGGSVIADAARARAANEAVLVADGVALRKGNGEGYDQAYAETLGPGVECRLLEQRPGWLRVELPDGRSGWIRADQAVVP